ncbi:uncharacterized protein JCM15063_006005 [Sporobolomyces koalae]|uniref:uncharacterized protein n=1 Tax=Sporobolomyces koalae TaxID=500713 RepID=UPI00316B1F40
MFGPDEDCDEWEEQREGMPGRDSAEVLLDTLEHLEELDVEGSSRVAKAFLRIGPSSSTSTTLFDTLRALDITAVFQYRIDPFADLYLWNLKRYKRLTTFSLDVRRDLTELRGIGYTPDEFPCPELLDLSLTGILSSSEYIPVILATCSCLTSLALCETSIDATVMILLESVQHPELIRHLQVWVTNEDAECTGDPVAQLARFSNLESIVIQGYWFPQTHGFYSTLSKLPLKTISFKEDTDVSIEHLLKLVSGPTKMSTLESIELNNVDASRGDLLPRDQGAEAVRDADLIGLNWNLPTWSRFFDRQGLRNLLRVAQSENIRIEGYSVTSLAIDDEWDKELEFYNSMVEPLTSVE